jgi:chromosomal replication initiation ATPase DnaA
VADFAALQYAAQPAASGRAVLEFVRCAGVGEKKFAMSDYQILLEQARATMNSLARMVGVLEAEAAKVERIMLFSPRSADLVFPLVKREVAAFYGFTVCELESVRKPEPLALARHVAFFLMREFSDETLVSIGLAFKGSNGGGKDHGSVLSGIRRIKNYCDVNPKLTAQIGQLRGILRSHLIPLEAAA